MQVFLLLLISNFVEPITYTNVMLALSPLPLLSRLCFGNFVCFHGSGFSQVFEFQQVTASNLLIYVSQCGNSFYSFTCKLKTQREK